MPEKPPDFAAILSDLEAHGVRFVLIGGLAMVAYGSAHITQDIAIGYARDRKNLEAISQSLVQYKPVLRGAPEGLPFIWDSRTLGNSFNPTLQTNVGAIDLLGEIPGVASFVALYQRSVPMNIYGVTVRVASIGDLIAMKIAANRTKDRLHLVELDRLRQLLGDA